MSYVGLTIAVMAVVMLIMGVGAMLGRRCLRGSCGGPELLAPDGKSLQCAACPNRYDDDEQPAAG